MRDAGSVLLVAGLLTIGPVYHRIGAQERSASIVGRVHDSTGASVPGVEVGVRGGGVRVRSDDSGTFRIGGLVPGPVVLVARRIGYDVYSASFRLQEGESRTVEIRLTPSPTQVEGVQVKAPLSASDSRLAGFRARSQTNVGYYVTRARIDRANSTFLSDMLREIPGVRVGPVRNQGRAIRLRGANCAPLIFVDGAPASAGEFDVDIIDLQSVEGIEVYSGSASIPSEFSGTRDLDRCGVIAIWSRPTGRPKARPRAAHDSSGAPLADFGDGPFR